MENSIVDGHPQMQALTYFENTSRVIEHLADSKIEAIQLGARRLPKGIGNVHVQRCFNGKRSTIDVYPTAL
jgi:hypothetical protein